MLSTDYLFLKVKELRSNRLYNHTISLYKEQYVLFSMLYAVFFTQVAQKATWGPLHHFQHSQIPLNFQFQFNFA